MRNRLIALLTASLLLVALASPAAAILNGTPDGDDHPYVGGLVTVVPTDDGPVNVLICSGAMISPTVFVTAGHCTDVLEDEGLPAFVTFDSEFDFLAPVTMLPGTPFTHPLFDVSFPDTYDVGVVELDDPVSLPRYASLPELGYLEELSTRRGHRDLTFTAVGYGAFGFASKGINYEPLFDDVRRAASVQYLGIRGGFADEWNLKHSGNQGKGRGSSCHGDSGGPVLSGDVIVAITSFGIAPQCAGNGYAFRADIPETQDFVTGGYSG